MKIFIEKLWTYMKLAATHYIIIITTSTLAMAHDNFAQVLDMQVSIETNQATLQQFIKRVEKIADVKFVYSASRLNITQKITVNETNIRLEDLLNKTLTPLHISFTVRENARTITLRRDDSIKTAEHSSIPVSHPSVLEVLITGSVKDSKTQVLMPGVNVVIKGTTNGTTTDSEGRFRLESNEDGVLVFSFIGYKSQEYRLGGRTIIDVAMEEDVQSLDEVIVNGGYYSTTKATQTGNIGKIEAVDIQRQPVSNPLAALQGRVPGLEITQQTGVPGGNFKVRIRGINSISNGNDPLYIIDGVPFISSTMAMTETSGSILGGTGSNPLNFLNPATIQSIEVLKDADATAIYGSRGSNGVILITTTRGKQGKTSVNVNVYSGIARVSRQMNLLDTKQYLTMRREAFRLDSITPTESNARDLLVWDTTRYTDWQKQLIGGTAHTTDAQLSIVGGENNTTFSVGSGYHRETTVFPGSFNDQRMSLQTTLTNVSANNKLTTSFTANYSLNMSTLPGLDLTERALTLAPNAPGTITETGELRWTDWTASYENPLAYTRREYEARTGNLIANTTISYELAPKLIAKINLGYTDISMKATSTLPISSQVPDPTNVNSSSFSNSSFHNWIAEPQLSWKRLLGSSSLDVLAGSTFLSQTSEGLAQGGKGYSSEALMKNLASAATIATAGNYYSQYKYAAGFARINYNVKGKYIINLTARRDGSSRFGPNKRFANFGAVGMAWIWSEENLIKSNLPFISFGKLRASYGTTGNDQLGDYQYLDTYTSSLGPYQGTVGLYPTRLSNPNFAWEVNRKTEASLELGFIQNRILINTSVYRNRSSNQLVGFPLPVTTGFNSIQGNFPATVQNQGLEIELTTQIVQHAKFKWTASANLTVPRNKLVAFPSIEDFPAYDNKYVVGQPLSIVKLYHNTGIDSRTGVYTFQDVNKDSTLNIEDATIAWFIGQKFYGGISNSLHFRGFQLDILLQFVSQTSAAPTTSFLMPGQLSNLPRTALDTWKDSGPLAPYQRLSTSGEPLTAFSLYVQSQNSIADASFARLKNVSLSYDIPANWLTKAHIQTFRLFVRCQNAFTSTRYKGLDPETLSSTLPPLRVFTIGFNATL